MGLVFEKKVDGPATHAMVIGVGYYKYLLGGEPERLFPGHQGLGQLTSPPCSAREYTDWLLTKYYNPDNPLESVDLFLSDATSDEYKVPISGESKQVERAKKQEITNGILDWKARGDDNKGDLMLFYFCGHGVSSGFRTVLLLEDFGEIPVKPFDNSIKFDDGLWLGMDRCAARKQCFFIDACRVASSELMDAYGEPGDPIITPLRRVQKRDAPVFNSTVLGERAYSRPNSPSIFTEALLRALNGAGSNNISGTWRVTADWLAVGLNHVIKILFEEQECEARVTSLFLHQIRYKPVVPVVVSCDPKKANSVAELSYAQLGGSKKVIRPKADAADWVVDVEAGRYLFKAEFRGNEYNTNSTQEEIRPPIQPVPIRV